jgi:hypothetical protein
MDSKTIVKEDAMAMQDLSAYLRNLKEQLSIQKKEGLAAQLDMDEQTLSKWCDGEALPDEDSCMKIALIAEEDPAKILILKHLSSAPMMARDSWEKIYIKYRYGRTAPKPEVEVSPYDRRHSVAQFTGVDRRARDDRRRGLDRRLALAI